MKFININKNLIVLFFLCQILNLSCKIESPIDKADWELTFSDEFSDTVLNHNIWKTEFPWGQSSSDDNMYYYIDSAFAIKDGILHIQAKRDTVMGLVHDDNYNYSYKQFYLTSGMLQSADSFSQQYGYFEIRSKVPYGMGFWPAFWLMVYSGWPPEIDVYEIMGSQPNRLHMANHFRDKNSIHRQNAITINGPDFSQDFHTFAIEWNPKEIIWYLDDVKVFRSEIGIPEERMYLILTLALGGDFAGEIDNTTPLPNSFDIDYIRVYRKKGT
ncbi:MAG: glycoside hydrolase family 16 protein [Bacteroidales bacterium]